MAKKPSDKTQLRRLRREHAALCEAYTETRERLRRSIERAENAEQEASGWKRRFDVLFDKMLSQAAVDIATNTRDTV